MGMKTSSVPCDAPQILLTRPHLRRWEVCGAKRAALTCGAVAALITHQLAGAVKSGGAMRRFVILFAILAAGWPAVGSGQPAIEEFYRGKKIDLVIGYSPGGTYDLYARLVARHLGRHLPGAPAIVPRNMPGAGSRTAANFVASLAPRDGTVLATADQSLALQQAVGDRRIAFDTTRFIYIGNPNVENNTTVTWHTSGVRTIDDAKRREVTMGATGGSTSSQYPKAMNALLGTRFKIILGYPGGNDINLAMERGEVDGRGSNSWASWKATRPQWLAEKKINILVQIGLKKAPDLPDVPLLMELGRSAQDRALLRLLSASTQIGRPIFTTPDVPPERVAALRAAFDAMVRDPAFLEDARKGHFEIEPVPGAALQRLVAEIAGTPRDEGERLRRIIE
jgi:tripartite-type tricarboxylate transporter receptor subunit TctC